MIWTVFRFLVLPLALGLVIAMVTVAAYWGLDALLAGHTDHVRGLWEGSAIALIINGGHALACLVLRRADAMRGKALS